MLKKNKLKKGLKFYNFGTGKSSGILEVIGAFVKPTRRYYSFLF
jgi:hypothetical protein